MDAKPSKSSSAGPDSGEHTVPIRSTGEKNRAGVPLILFWSFAVVLLFCNLGAKEIWGPEDRWAQIAREMQLSGDYFHPTINGRPYFDKPLLSYWLIALMSAITGRLDEMVLRIPSAIAGLVALWATMNLGQRLFSKQAALTAGWILLGTYGFVFWSRTGEADMENLAAIILAVAWYWAHRDKGGFFCYLIFYLICFIGAHAKGMATIAVPLIVVLPDAIRRERRRLHFCLSNVLALVIGVAAYLAPFLYADFTRDGYEASGLWSAFRGNVTRYFRPFNHKEPFYVYFYYLPRLFFPWTVLLVAAVWTCWDNFKKLLWPAKWLATSTLLIFLFFTLSGSRRSYYILPILPFCALLVSQYLAIEPKERSARIMLAIQTGLLGAILIMEMVSPVAWPVLERTIGFVPPPQFKLATLLLGFAGAVYLVGDLLLGGLLAGTLHVQPRMMRNIVTAAIITGGFFLFQEKSLDDLRSLKAFSIDVRQTAESLGRNNIAFFRDFPAKILFHLETTEPVRVLSDVEDLRSFLDSKKEPWILIAHSEYRDEMASVLLREMVGQPAIREKIYPWEKGKKKYEAWIINPDMPNAKLTSN